MRKPQRSNARGPERRAERSGSGERNDARAHVAQVAARLIAEHGLSDWTLAKRKAARDLMVDEREGLPDDGEIEDALADYHAIFGGEAHIAQLAAQRAEALAWMRRLAAFRPKLVGGVAAGWATEHSDIRLELTADDEKEVELALINAGIDYRSVPARPGGASGELQLDTPCGGLRLIVYTPAAARQRPRRDRNGKEALRLDAETLAALLG